MSDALREAEMLAFEAWMRSDGTLPLDRDSFDYADFHVALMWHAWEAARSALTAPPAPAVPLTADQHFALREAHTIGASDAYFKVWPTHDNDAGRMLFERGFVRGFDSHARLVERAAPQPAPQPTQED